MIPVNLISVYSDWDCLIISDMSNEWFQFRQFLIRQDRSAMKVGTDGVLLGAWVGRSGSGNGKILDIGTGTGLVALMLAQRNPGAFITAIEIDKAAAAQAMENVQRSPWPDRIGIVQADFRDWQPAPGLKFDLIACNPPFFARSLKNPDIQRAMARHDEDLPLETLIRKSVGLLTPDGKIALIVPFGRADEAFDRAKEYGIFLHRRMNVRGHAGAPVKRVLLEWGRTGKTIENHNLVIETSVRGVYSEEYRNLTTEFYPRFR